jgi:hypothetical protein
MKGNWFSEGQIIEISREAEAGLKSVAVRRRHGSAEATQYKWEVLVNFSQISHTWL